MKHKSMSPMSTIAVSMVALLVCACGPTSSAVPGASGNEVEELVKTQLQKSYLIYEGDIFGAGGLGGMEEVQYRGWKIHSSKDALTDADKLNGITEAMSFYITADAQRFWNPRTTMWSEWTVPYNRILARQFSNDPERAKIVIAARIQKKNAEVTVSDSLQVMGINPEVYRPPALDEIKARLK